MLFETVFERFVQESPASVMVRALLENVLQPGPLDELFERTATVQYTDHLLFSSVVDVMGLVVTGYFKSPHAVHHHPKRPKYLEMASLLRQRHGIRRQRPLQLGRIQRHSG